MARVPEKVLRHFMRARLRLVNIALKNGHKLMGAVQLQARRSSTSLCLSNLAVRQCLQPQGMNMSTLKLPDKRSTRRVNLRLALR